MKIACTADWHIHEFQDFAKQITVKWNNRLARYEKHPQGKEMNSRLFHILSGICDIRDYCKSHNIHHVLHAGDVFHKRGSITVNAFNAAHRVIQTFYSAGLELLIIAGNHDQVDASNSPETSIHTMAKSYGVTIVESPSIHSLSWVNEMVSVVCMPYIRNKTYALESLFNLIGSTNMSPEEMKQSILLMHCGITGGAVGSGMHLMTDDFSLEELRGNKWKYVVLGHYHQPQMLSKNAFYCGTPVQNSFSDELPDNEIGGYNGFFVIDTNKQHSIEFISVIQPRFITVNNIDDIASHYSDNYFRVKATPEVVESISDLGDNVRVELEKDYSVDARSSIGLADTFENAVKKYFQENYSGDYDKALELGLSILSEAQN